MSAIRASFPPLLKLTRQFASDFSAIRLTQVCLCAYKWEELKAVFTRFGQSIVHSGKNISAASRNGNYTISFQWKSNTVVKLPLVALASQMQQQRSRAAVWINERHGVVQKLGKKVWRVIKSLQALKNTCIFFFFVLYRFTCIQMVFSIVKHFSESSGQAPGSKTDDISSSKLPDQKHKDIHKGFISMRAYSLFSKELFSSYKKFSFIKMFIL